MKATVTVDRRTTRIKLLPQSCPRQNEHSTACYPPKYRGQTTLSYVFYRWWSVSAARTHHASLSYEKPYESKKNIQQKVIDSKKVLSAYLAFWFQNSVFEGPFRCNPNKVDRITKAACVLQNYIRHHDGMLSTPRTDQELTNANNWIPQAQRLDSWPHSHNSPANEG